MWSSEKVKTVEQLCNLAVSSANGFMNRSTEVEWVPARF